MVFYDKLGRTWNNRKVVWIRRANACRFANYDLLNSFGGTILTYTNKGKSLIKNSKGMYDKNGIHIQEAVFETIPALEGMLDGKPNPGTWEHFPNTEDALLYMETIKLQSTNTFDIVEGDKKHEDDYNNKEILD